MDPGPRVPSDPFGTVLTGGGQDGAVRRGAALGLALVLLLIPPVGARTEVSWRLIETERVVEGTLSEGGERSFDLAVEGPNLTHVEFTLAWQDSDRRELSGPDRFTMRLTGPDGLAATRDGDGGQLVAGLDVADVPDAKVADAADLDAWSSTRGAGVWRVVVRLEDVADPAGTELDPGEDFALLVRTSRYEAVPLRVVTLDEPEVASRTEHAWGAAAGGLALLAAGLGVAAWRRKARAS